MTNPKSIAIGARRPIADRIPHIDDIIVCPEPVTRPFKQNVAGTIR
jgi:hypothetical protein